MEINKQPFEIINDSISELIGNRLSIRILIFLHFNNHNKRFNLSAIARMNRTAISNITIMVDKLECLGLVQSYVVSDYRRKRIAVITQKGHEVAELLVNISNKIKEV